mmetsp:Transcript_23694/g.23586  ORF Transcript_23694/g.23586 Transcript_23694/m.23586 type:complete len:103 (-) Transcript_23694:20-328(-)|eukprot:CAMPEP_0197003852 /NCGR_PEP_ID=MMETSP1380-20130617/14494_1 /TAXON_ID=5936 /ORGANISM="Euplotes crassus, Strain CT5" /LENGTH=102 /DNA_ID=CAMNT_0042422459 /DNA_START=117 /DNA_END=425 /DNA_ORIENTATION=-
MGSKAFSTHLGTLRVFQKNKLLIRSPNGEEFDKEDVETNTYHKRNPLWKNSLPDVAESLGQKFRKIQLSKFNRSENIKRIDYGNHKEMSKLSSQKLLKLLIN